MVISVKCLWCSEEFQLGEKLVLSTKNIKKFCSHLPTKIKVRWVGPFIITQKVSPVAYQVVLPPGWCLHPLFHISKLKNCTRPDELLREVQLPPPTVVEYHLEYEVEGPILHRGKGAR